MFKAPTKKKQWGRNIIFVIQNQKNGQQIGDAAQAGLIRT